MLQVNSAVGKVMSSKVYALSDGISKDYYLIDIGDFDAAQSLLPKDANVRGVFITHGHHDHIMGINDLKTNFPDCIVYVSKVGKGMLRSSKANLSFYVDTPIAYEGEVVVLQDGDSIKLFKNINLSVVATPGHNPSCLSYIVEKYIFTGDSYIPGVKIVTNLPKGNKKEAAASLMVIKELSKGRIICPGHQPLVNCAP